MPLLQIMNKRGYLTLALTFGLGILTSGVAFLYSGQFGLGAGFFELCATTLGGAFMPHGHCYFWKPELLWLHVGSDTLISLSYFSIPFGLIIFANKRKEASFRGLFILFGAFICLCGLTHALSIYNIWHASYWVSGFLKAATGFVSIATAYVLLKSLPTALSIPLPAEYQRVTNELEMENLIRRRTEEQLEARIGEQSQELWESDSRWRLLTDFMCSATWLTDEEGSVSQVMPRWEIFTGQTRTEYSGYGWLSAYRESDRDGMYLEWQRCLAEGTNFEFESHLWSQAEQQYVPVISRGVPIKGGDGKIQEWLGAIYDLSEIKAQQSALASYSRRLKAKNSYLQEFTHVASHDLREPLRKIRAYGDILKTDYGDSIGEGQKKCIDVMQGAAGRMSTLIDDLLHYSKVSNAELSPEKVSLTELLAGVLGDLEVAIDESAARVEFENLHDVEVDPLLFGRVLQNLVGNAVKYRAENRPLVVTVKSRIVSAGDLAEVNEKLECESYYEIEISDTGIGFEMKHVERIQKPFQRLHDRGSYTGSGMGLAICRRIMEQHRGWLSIKSELGKGSVFTVYVPRWTGPFGDENSFE